MVGKARRKFGVNTSKQDRLNKATMRQSNLIRSQNTLPATQLQSVTSHESLSVLGGIMLGPTGGQADTIAISSGILDLTQNAAGKTIKVRPIYFVDTESGTTDTLDAIETNGEELNYQQLRIIGITGDTITITHAFGSTTGTQRAIQCPGDMDFTLSGNNVVDLQYDETTDNWLVVGTSGSIPLEVWTSDGDDDFLPNNATEYTSFGFNGFGSTVAGREAPVPVAGTLQKVVIRIRSWNHTANVTAQVQKNGIDVGGASVTITGNGQFDITAIDESYAADDTFTLKMSTSGTGTSRMESWGSIWEQNITGVGGSGGSFPSRPPVTGITSPTSTQDLDLNTTAGHVFRITVDKDVTLTFSNPPADLIQHSFQIELTNSSTSVARTVTLPSSVRQLSSISIPATTPVSRGKYTLETNDGGVNYDIVQVVKGTSGTGSGSGWSTFPALQNVDMDNFDFTDIRNLRFGINGQLHPTEPHIYADASGDMVFNVASTDKFFWTINDVVVGGLADAELEVRTVTEDGPTIKLNNNDQTPVAADTVGTLNFTGNDDLLANVIYGGILVTMDDPTNTTKQGGLEVRVMSDNTIAPIIDYSGSDATFRFSSNVDAVRPNRDNGIAFGAASQSWADSYFANFLEIKEMAAPGNPPANSGRLYVADNAAVTTLYFKDSAGTVTNLLESDSATTALDNLASVAINTALISDTTDTDDLGSASIYWRDAFLSRNLRFGTSGQTHNTEPHIYADASGDMVFNVATSDQFFWTINGTTEAVLDATALDLKGELVLTSSATPTTTEVAMSSVAGDFFFNCLTTDSFFFREAGTTVIELDADGVDIRTGWLEMTEITAPTGLANHCRLYTEDSGGKTRLMAIFGTGAAQQIAIEP